MTSFDTNHNDMIHDAQMDYYGKRLATCSSDRTIKIFNVATDNNSPQLIAELSGHEGPVWQIAWAHPHFGNVIASASYDKKVIIWKEVNNQWKRVFEYTKHELSVNTVAWAPHEFGLQLACGSSDGKISVLTAKENDVTQWSETIINRAHDVGVTAVSWSQATSPSSLLATASSFSPPTRRFASAGCDNLVKIWRFVDAANKWELEDTLSEHESWVRDVAWSANIGLPYDTIASCSQDGVVAIWRKNANSEQWTCKKLLKFPAIVWRVSWSITGNILAVSSGDNAVSLWKESLERDGEWQEIEDTNNDQE